MVGGGFTQSGGAIWLGVSIAWINTAVPSAEPFHTLLYVNSLTPGSTGSGISEDVFGSMTNYTATPVNCPAS
jgi:hypothetical protein